MDKEIDVQPKSRVAFLLTLAIAVSLLCFWVIQDFVLTLVFAAIVAGLAHPFYGRLRRRVGNRRGLAAGLTVLLALGLVIVPLLLFVGVVVGQAIDVSEAAKVWVAEQVEQSGSIQQRLEADPDLKQLLPYQDEILAKAGELASKAGSAVAQGLAGSVAGTVKFFLTLFVMLSAMFAFLVDGQAMLRGATRFMPLSEGEKSRLLGTYVAMGRATLKGSLVIGIAQGGLAGLSFWVAGIGGAVFWGAVMTVLSIIPGIGTALVWVPAVIFLLLNGQVGAAVGVGLWCALVVGTIDNILRPILVGKETQMPDILVMVTTFGGLAIFGFAGMLFGPLIGALFMTVWSLWSSAMDEHATGVAKQTPSP